MTNCARTVFKIRGRMCTNPNGTMLLKLETTEPANTEDQKPCKPAISKPDPLKEMEAKIYQLNDQITALRREFIKLRFDRALKKEE